MENTILEYLTILHGDLQELIKERRDDFLSAKEISEKYGINYESVLEMFKDTDLPVVRRIRPQRVLESEFIKYLSKGE